MQNTYLLQALALAETQRGFCAPNPSVGAVVVKNNQVLSTGVHRGPGHSHAEAEALHALSAEQTQGASLYVTLEPCNHTGRTPPCTTLIQEKKIARVFFGFKDPNTQVAGQGQSALQKAGIICEHMPLPEITDFYQSYAWYCERARPYTTAKIALSLDGKIAKEQGVRAHITGEAFQIWVHKQRLKTDGILTTQRTIARDDPLLNVRLTGKTLVKPLYILDRRLETSLKAKIFSTGAPLTFFYDPAQTSPKHVELFEKNGTHRCIPISDLSDILDYLGKCGLHDLWIEAGGRCFQQFALEKHLNKAYIALGLVWLGDKALSAFTQDIFQSAKHVHGFSLGKDLVAEVYF